MRELDDSLVKAYAYIRLVPKPGPKRFRAVVAMLDLNDTISSKSVKFETHGHLAQQTNEGDWFVTVDMLSGYHHAQVSEASQPYLAYRWDGRTWAWCVLPFGARPAPRVFTKMMRPIIAYLRGLGIRCGIYLDEKAPEAERVKKLGGREVWASPSKTTELRASRSSSCSDLNWSPLAGSIHCPT